MPQVDAVDRSCGISRFPNKLQFHSRNVINRMALRPYEIRCYLDASAHDLVEDQTGYLSILPNNPAGTTLHPHDALSQSSSPNRSHPSRPDFHKSFPAPYFHSPSHLSGPSPPNQPSANPIPTPPIRYSQFSSAPSSPLLPYLPIYSPPLPTPSPCPDAYVPSDSAIRPNYPKCGSHTPRCTPSPPSRSSTTPKSSSGSTGPSQP